MPKNGFIPNKLRPWIEARKKYHLSHAQIQMARELGLNPKIMNKEATLIEKQQKYVALCIAPLLQDRTGKNLLICGTPGIGKTATIK